MLHIQPKNATLYNTGKVEKFFQTGKKPSCLNSKLQSKKKGA